MKKKKLLILLISIMILLPIHTVAEEAKKTITVSAAGDCTLGYYPKQSTWNRFDTVAKAKGYSYFLENVKPIFEKDDLTIVNLEGPLTLNGKPADKEFAFRGLPAYVEILKSGSIESVNLANNHTLDYGTIGYTDTQKVLKDNKIGYFGGERIEFKTINGIRVAMIGTKGWYFNEATKDFLAKQIKIAKEKSDLIIVEFHWGEERVYYPNITQKKLARYAIDQGAHLILGSHPHVVQGIENYKGVNIVYSLGNFCFGGNRNPSDKDSFIYQQSFELTDKGIVLGESEIIPCSISSVKDKNDYKPTPLVGTEKERLLKRIQTLSRGIK
ncbi:hypothetical protein CS063_05865 [Sporanaerobium hydrogeniformans]|uniref:Uncharacterized protein n=1 Tax=Sporanaerobium hydrogeniformans TaxID=3072179 RepID=A0AC61DE83_9FIRM|nr:CapA family protein [Sporanaerobium hydrogeniformans]PHV71217.1 hypothetical protein CS063_05865 [Sporanaerobium hydrogeniformans]